MHFKSRKNFSNYLLVLNRLILLQIFSVLCDEELIKQTQQGFMHIELWQRNNKKEETLLGSTKIPLHQFFIAFNNGRIRNHMSKQKVRVHNRI